jgi:hypothetical protein
MERLMEARMTIQIAKQVDVVVEPKVLKIHCKVCDNFSAGIEDKDGNELHYQEDGYVPGFMPGDHYGDYLILDIDLESGKVLNWKPPSADSIQEWVNGK